MPTSPIRTHKRKGLVPLAKPFIERLVAVGLYIDSAILARILIGVGEADKKSKNFLDYRVK